MFPQFFRAAAAPLRRPSARRQSNRSPTPFVRDVPGSSLGPYVVPNNVAIQIPGASNLIAHRPELPNTNPN